MKRIAAALVLIPVHSHDVNRGKQVVQFTDWLLGEGQDLAPTLHYARLPAQVVTRAKQALQQVQ